MEYKLIISGTLPNLNDYIDQLNISKFRGHRCKKNAELRIAAFIKRQLKGVEIFKPIHAGFLWVEPNMKRDKDNIAFAKKFIFDALVKSKVIKNDGWAWMDGFSDDFMVDRLHPRIEVTLREVEP